MESIFDKFPILIDGGMAAIIALVTNLVVSAVKTIFRKTSIDDSIIKLLTTVTSLATCILFAWLLISQVKPIYTLPNILLAGIIAHLMATGYYEFGKNLINAIGGLKAEGKHLQGS